MTPRPHRSGLAVSTIWGDLLWCDGGWPGSCHEHELVELSGLGEVLDAASVAAGPGVSGAGQGRERWRAGVGDRRTKDRLSEGRQAFNRLQAVARAGGAVDRPSCQRLVLRRWRGLLYRVRDVFQAAGALICSAGGCTGYP